MTICHAEIFTTWQSVMWKISPHDRFFLHQHRWWCWWQISGMCTGFWENTQMRVAHNSMHQFSHPRAYPHSQTSLVGGPRIRVRHKYLQNCLFSKDSFLRWQWKILRTNNLNSLRRLPQPRRWVCVVSVNLNQRIKSCFTGPSCFRAVSLTGMTGGSLHINKWSWFSPENPSFDWSWESNSKEN